MIVVEGREYLSPQELLEKFPQVKQPTLYRWIDRHKVEMLDTTVLSIPAEELRAQHYISLESFQRMLSQYKPREKRRSNVPTQF